MAQWVNNISDWELLARTLQAEAGNQGPEGMIAVGSVIMNRAGGDPRKIRDVILKRGQFSAWNSLTGYAGGEQGQDMENMQPSEMAFTVAANLINNKYTDPTGGATHYYNPTISSPAWGQSKAGGDWQQIGDHLFGNADVKRAGESPRNPQPRISTNNPTTETLSRVGSELNMQPKSPLLQSIMNESGYPNMGMPPIAGYSTPAQAPQAAPQQPKLPSGNNAPRGGFGRIMDFLGDARKAQQLSALSRTDFGRRMNEMATARVGQQLSNRTVEYLRSQDDGEPFAREIEAGANPAEVMAKYRNQATKAAGTFGTTPHFIKGPDGTIKVIRFGTDGSRVIEDLPEGFELAKGTYKVETDTHTEIRDKLTNELLYTIDKNVGDAAFERQQGQMRAEDIAELPTTIARSEAAIQLIDEIIESGHVPLILGPVQGRVTPSMIGARLTITGDGINLLQKISRLQGSVFLEAFQRLKGGGQITEIEGAKAEASMIDLNNRFVDPSAYIGELRNLKSVIQEGMRLAKDKVKVKNPYSGTFEGNLQTTVSDGPAGEQPASNQQQTDDEGWTPTESGGRIRLKKDS